MSKTSKVGVPMNQSIDNKGTPTYGTNNTLPLFAESSFSKGKQAQSVCENVAL